MTRHIIASVLLASIASPSIAFAETAVNADLNVRVGTDANVRTQICVQVSDHLLRIENRFADLLLQVDARRDDQHAKLEAKRADREGRIADRESKDDQKRADLMVKLEAEAVTGTQKAAVVKFRADVQAAIRARRAAFQTANETYRRTIEDAITRRRASVDAAVNAFHASVKAAITKARQDCLAGGVLTNIKTTLSASIQAARNKFQQDRKNVDRVGEQTKAAVKVRQDAHAKAMANFRAAMEKARVELKAALSAKTTTP